MKEFAAPTPGKKHPTDEELMIQFRRGNPHALTPLNDRYNNHVVNYLRLRMRGHNRENAEDLAQEVWIKVYQKSFMTYDETQQFRGWLFTIAHNEADNWNKKKSNHAEPDKKELLQSMENTYSMHLPFGLTRKIIAHCMSKLTENYRHILKERFWMNKTCEQIAKETGRTKGTILNSSHKALHRMKKMLMTYIEPGFLSRMAVREGRKSQDSSNLKKS